MKRRECTGCGACYNICPKNCIKMKKDFEGFYYPMINRKKCINCGKCIDICPVRKEKDKDKNLKQKPVYVGYCKEDKIRNVSSSGGIFPLVADIILKKEGVVYGACYESNVVVHASTDSKNDIQKFIGSKYVQSDTKRTYKEVEMLLKQKKIILFTGLPCQIKGLKAYLGKEYEGLYTIDLICHGVGAPGIWEKYIKVFHGKKSIKSINFKNKDNGWNHEQFVITYEDNSEYRKDPLEDCYTYGFNKNVFLRPSCYNCKFKGMNRSSDLTIGDAWGVERYMPKLGDDKGCSLIFLLSEKGEYLFDKIKSNMNYAEIDARKAVRFNQRMMTSVPTNPQREVFFKDLSRYPFWLVMKKMMKYKK